MNRVLPLLLASTLVNMTASAIAPLLPTLKQFFSDDPIAAHWVPDLITFPGLFTIISALATGWAIDHWGRLIIFRLGLILYAIGGSSGGLCSSIIGLFVSRMIIGFAVGIILTTSIALIADYFSGEQRRKILGWQMCAIGVGGAASTLLSGILTDISWRLAFGLYLFSFVVLACSYSLHETQPHQIHTPQSPPPPVVPLFIKKILIVVLPTGILISTSGYTIFTQLSLHIEKVSHIFATKLSLILIGPTLAISAMSLLYPHLKKHFSFGKMHALGFFTSGCGYLTVASLPNNLLCNAAGFALIGAGMGLCLPNLSSWVNFTTPVAYRGRANGILTTTLFGGQFLTPVLFDQFFHVFSYTMAVIACTFCLWIVAILFLGLPRKYSETQPAD